VTHDKVIASWVKIIICGGPPDHVDELARRLGRHRVWRTDWPEGLISADAARLAIESAVPYPIEGIYHPTAEAMLAYRARPPIPTMSTGCSGTDAIMKLPTEGKLIIVTGIPSHGKSTWVRHVMGHTALHEARRWAVFSPEMGEWQDFSARVIGWLANSHFRAMTHKSIAEWAEWCNTRFAYISCDSEKAAPTLDWLLQRFRVCVVRDGATDAVLDPWNQIEHQRGQLNETDYIDAALRRLSAFGRRHGCNIWIIAHPTKMRSARPGDPLPVPSAYDISGSSAWYNKADMVITVYRTDGISQIHMQKAKFERWQGGDRVAGDAKHVIMAELEYDRQSGRFTSADVNHAMRDAVDGKNAHD
jgi:twinkle protein